MTAGDEDYIRCFRTVLQAIREKRRLNIRFHSRTGARHSITCIPCRLEYSAKDDKFRLLAAGTRRDNVINLARVEFCELLEEYDPDSFQPPEKNLHELVLLLHDERNGLERVLSFGPVLEAKAPAEFIALVKGRVDWQTAHTL